MDVATVIYYKCTACSDCFMNEQSFVNHTRSIHCKILICQGHNAGQDVCKETGFREQDGFKQKDPIIVKIEHADNSQLNNNITSSSQCDIQEILYNHNGITTQTIYHSGSLLNRQQSTLSNYNSANVGGSSSLDQPAYTFYSLGQENITGHSGAQLTQANLLAAQPSNNHRMGHDVIAVHDNSQTVTVSQVPSGTPVFSDINNMVLGTIPVDLSVPQLQWNAGNTQPATNVRKRSSRAHRRKPAWPVAIRPATSQVISEDEDAEQDVSTTLLAPPIDKSLVNEINDITADTNGINTSDETVSTEQPVNIKTETITLDNEDDDNIASNSMQTSNHDLRQNSYPPKLSHRSITVRGAHMRMRNFSFQHGSGQYKCHLCDKSFQFPSLLRMHQRYHTGERPYICDECGSAFRIKGTLKVHQRIHTGERPYRCDQCDAAFTQSHCLKSHKQKKHGRSSGGRQHLLGHSNRSGVGRGALGHWRRRTANQAGDEGIKCEHCSKVFKFPCLLRLHERVHTGERPFKCDECDAAFTQNHCLKSHQERIHGKVLPSKSPPRRLADARDVSVTLVPFPGTRRSYADPDPKPYQCDECTAAFRSKSVLLIHQRTHTGERPYPCDHCDSAFTQAHCLKSHMENIHGVIAEKRHKCSVCGENFEKLQGLKIHKNWKHKTT